MEGLGIAARMASLVSGNVLLNWLSSTGDFNGASVVVDEKRRVSGNRIFEADAFVLRHCPLGAIVDYH